MAGLTLDNALTPTPVFKLVSHVVGQSCALSGGESENQQSAIASEKKPQRNGVRLLGVRNVFIFVYSFLWNLPY